MNPEQLANAMQRLDDYVTDLELNGSVWLAVTKDGDVLAEQSLDDLFRRLGSNIDLEDFVLKFVSSEIWQ